ncbi:hypothetical protein M413DRAFT_440163 [Hebeloma cylindrosporum]|uniref:ferroxidase n=1 Tax=Hebeloma cylindrosporum TaxID=76867 RepID=A0A0C3CX48_HEBCY|nr:hypothetical protein M413DRAFT_440163 [Hebeloma cylindrosporum h7]
MLSHTLRSLCRCSAALTQRIPHQVCAIRRIQRASLPHHTSVQSRMMSTPPPQVNESHLSMDEYHTIADKTMEGLLETLEELLDAEADTGFEVDYHVRGVLTLKLGSHGTYVINKQPPNKQIWLSSPLSGPKRYDFHEETGEWVYSRDGRSFDNLLSDELSKVFSQNITIRS